MPPQPHVRACAQRLCTGGQHVPCNNVQRKRTHPSHEHARTAADAKRSTPTEQNEVHRLCRTEQNDTDGARGGRRRQRRGGVPGRSVLVQQCKSEECESRERERRRGSLREGEEAGTKDDEGTEMRPADEGLTGRPRHGPIGRCASASRVRNLRDDPLRARRVG